MIWYVGVNKSTPNTEFNLKTLLSTKTLIILKKRFHKIKSFSPEQKRLLNIHKHATNYNTEEHNIYDQSSKIA